MIKWLNNLIGRWFPDPPCDIPPGPRAEDVMRQLQQIREARQKLADTESFNEEVQEVAVIARWLLRQNQFSQRVAEATRSIAHER